MKGNIGITTENIFPVIKKFLYSDHEIFLREIVANAVDATQKICTLSSKGEFKGELGDLTIQVSLDKEAGTLTISDHGIGMTDEEVDRYINQIAFSGATDFLEKYKDDAAAIIGHFGLGFYSSFMVADTVEIITLSHREGAKAVKWTCDGSPSFDMEETEKTERGTDIVLHISEDCKEFLEKYRIEQLLTKYCRFLPVEIAFGKKTKWEDGQQKETDELNIINDTHPLWTRKPAELKDEDYIKFYQGLYPMQDDPLFWIHLNVDYPFNLTGVLYFPKIKNQLDVRRNGIQLYCNQVFVTDQVENIVPDFLTLLHGVIDSPDIPLNVSRSYLQSDANVKKISGYITKKVADRLKQIFKNQREEFEQKWDDLKLFIHYGILSEQDFYEKAKEFALLKDTEGKYYTYNEYRELIKDAQTDKDGNLICLYTNDLEKHFSLIEAARLKGYNVLMLDGQLDAPLVSTLEQKWMENQNEGKNYVRFTRVDSDTLDRLIAKESTPEQTEEEKKASETLTKAFEGLLPKLDKTEFTVQAAPTGADSLPILITQNEYMRRMKEMSQIQQGMNIYGDIPATYNLLLNTDHRLVRLVQKEENPAESPLIPQLIDLALLQAGLLKGESLSKFIKRSIDLI